MDDKQDYRRLRSIYTENIYSEVGRFRKLYSDTIYDIQDDISLIQNSLESAIEEIENLGGNPIPIGGSPKATEEWVMTQLLNYATKGDLDNLPPSGISSSELSSILSAYVKDEELESLLESYYTSSEVDQKFATKEDLNLYLKKADAEATYAHISDLDSYATKEYVDNKTVEVDLSEYAKQSDLVPLATKEYVDSLALEGSVDISTLDSLATKEYVDNEIQDKSVTTSNIEVILQDYATKDEVGQVFEEASSEDISNMF